MKSQIIGTDECYTSNGVSLLKKLTTNNCKPGDLIPDIEGVGRTPPHEHENCSRWNANLMQWL